MSINFAARLCGECHRRDEDADRADIWIGMAGLLVASKNDYFTDYAPEKPVNQYYVEAMQMLDDLNEYCDGCNFQKPLNMIRVKGWLEKFNQTVEVSSKEKGTQRGNVYYPRRFQTNE